MREEPVAGANEEDIHDLRWYLEDWSHDLELLRQNKLLGEAAFIGFARHRGTAVTGVIKGDPGDFSRRGWLPHDGLGQDGKPQFHPFRVYPLHRILEACRLNISVSSSLNRVDMPGFVARVQEEMMPSVEQIGVAAIAWNRIADLAILLDPLYWPTITGIHTRSVFMSEEQYEARLEEYRAKALRVVEKLDPDEWRRLHERLRIDAAGMDENGALYLLLRLSTWTRRKEIKGRISGALWIRHMAETVRRAFEEVHTEHWQEEDRAYGVWTPGGRTVVYGSERPLDDALESRPRLPFHFGLFTGSTIRWYVEGDTEYYATLSVLSEPSKVGVELVNLRGNLASERANIALKLTDGLAEDRALRRFSMVSFDMDVAANVKAIRRHIQQGNIVGYIGAHDPDFEFANFTLDELSEIAARVDEAHGVSGDIVRQSDWIGVKCGRDFEKRYSEVSARQPAGLKGAEWGRAMAVYAFEHPQRSDDHSERPFCREIRAALQCRIAHYDLQKKNLSFDPDNFALVDDRD